MLHVSGQNQETTGLLTSDFKTPDYDAHLLNVWNAQCALSLFHYNADTERARQHIIVFYYRSTLFLQALSLDWCRTITLTAC